MSQLQRLERVVVLDRLSKALVVLIFQIDVIQGLVDSTDVLVLDTLKKRSDQSNVAGSLHDGHTLSEIDLGSILEADKSQNLVQKHGLFF